MSQCLRAAEAMFEKHFSPPVMPVLMPKPVGDINQTAIPPPMERQPYPAARSFQTRNATAAQPISIQPRPSPNGYPAPSPSTSSPPMLLPFVMPGRKRGRPSKADREARGRANASQSGGYTPISPAPIAPSPAPPTAQNTYSPGPSAAPAYQLSPGSAPEPRPKKKARTTAADTQQQTENVPRSVQGSPESADQKIPGAALDYGWRDNTRRVDQIQAGNPGPVPLEPPIQPQRPATVHQPIHSPRTSLPTAGVHRATVASPVVEQATTDGHSRVANQA